MIKKKTSFNLETNQPRRKGRLANFWASQLLVSFIGLIFLIMISIPLLRNYAKQRAVANEIAGIQKEINDFESKNKDLSEMLSYLQSNASLEEQARLNLGLKKPGEKVIVINAKDMASSSDATAGPEETSNFIKWWHYFFKH